MSPQPDAKIAVLGGADATRLHTGPTLADQYRAVRAATLALCESLEPEDMVVQSMADASPAKWHLAHTTWFFENFLLVPRVPGYRVFDEQFGFLFNSYYYTVGQMHRRPERGLLSRPTVARIRAYRSRVDEGMAGLLEQAQDDHDLTFLVMLGLNHEQQHQELLLTDVKHMLSRNPLQPAFRDTPRAPTAPPAPLEFLPGRDGLADIGHDGAGFCFDNETPRHQTLLRPHALANRPVTNGEFLEFVRDGGYRRNELWLSDGWAAVLEQGWERPLYWSESLDTQFTLAGTRDLDVNAPLCHVSFYEADAFARWAGTRLPTEAEWEAAASGKPAAGNFVESGVLHTAAGTRDSNLQQLFGDVWEWTQSPYSPYPGFKPLAGSLGEYNGKFMCNQLVLRGGSCATAASHMRATYRNFFYPHQRWQFSGIRLAKDL